MNKSRRNFLVQLGSAALFGAGTAAGIHSLTATSAFGATPTGSPGIPKGTRWGMFVDMARCEAGCSDCITACHTKHNVPDFGNPKDEIKWIWKDSYAKVFPTGSQQFLAQQLADKPVLSLCNHCANPPCVKVCPTQATFKRADGIVEMDFHRCIGCRFCMAACPYGSRSFNWRNPREFLKQVDAEYPTREIGVVEKCNFCSERIGTGRQPACVETCKTQALVFGNLYDKDSEIREKLRTRVTFQRKPELGTEPSVFYAFEAGHV